MPECLRLSCWALIAALFVTLAGCDARRYQKDAVKREISPQELSEALESEGLSCSMEGNNTIIGCSINETGLKILFIILEDPALIESSSVFESEALNLALINKWNSTTILSKAFLCENGDAVLEAWLDMESGITRNQLVSFLRTAKLSTLAFAQYLYDETPDIRSE